MSSLSLDMVSLPPLIPWVRVNGSCWVMIRRLQGAMWSSSRTRTKPAANMLKMWLSDCMVVQVGTGRFPLALTQASRQWNDQEWAAAIVRLAQRGWVDADGAMTTSGTEARDRIEVETDRLCGPIWQSIGDSATARLTQLIAPITAS